MFIYTPLKMCLATSDPQSQLGENYSHLFYLSPMFNPFKPEFTIVIFIHYKPRIAENVLLLFKKFNKKCSSKTPRCEKLSHFSEIKNDTLMHREGWKV